jgi:hypothetical protein
VYPAEEPDQRTVCAQNRGRGKLGAEPATGCGIAKLSGIRGPWHRRSVRQRTPARGSRAGLASTMLRLAFPALCCTALASTAAAQFTFNNLYPGPLWSVHASDLSGDGVPDVVHADGTNRLQVRQNNGFGQFPTLVNPIEPSSQFVEARIFDADFNAGDDIAAVDRANSRIVLFLCMVWPNYFPLVTQTALTVPTNPLAVIDFDLEGDGDRDLAVISSGPPNVLTILENVNSGTGPGLSWNQVQQIPLTFVPSTITAGQVGGSALDDLVVVSMTDSAMHVFENVGGTIGAGVRFATDLRPWEATIADLDRDGDNDIGVTSTGKGALDVFLSTGVATITAATFPLPTPYAAVGSSGLVGIDSADLDCDGDIDIVCAAATSGTLAVFRNAGNGTFAGATVAPVLPSTPRDVDLANLDPNGNPDVVLNSPFSAAAGGVVLFNNLTCGQCIHTLRAGIEDNMSAAVPAGVEDAVPGPVLQTQVLNQRHFDGSAVLVNADFGHTFGALPPGIVAARLQIRLRASGLDVPGNDSLSLQANSVGGFSWTRTLPFLTGTPWPVGSPTVAVLNLDLDNLPGGGASLIAAMNSTGRLDVYVQDDTRVDYARLELVTQCPTCHCDFTATAVSFLAGQNAPIQVTGAMPSSLLTIGIGTGLGNGPLLTSGGQPFGQHCILGAVTYTGIVGTATGTATLTLPIPAGPLPVGALRSVQVLSMRLTPLALTMSNTLRLPMYD